LLLLLVRLICRNDALPFAGFVCGMRAYGLAPQTPREQDRLADALERLGLLVRYSDAGESAYVHYAL
jgi:DNA phosphorothioation-dependent restriction protein DptG